MGLLDRLQHAWNAFTKSSPYDDTVNYPTISYQELGNVSSYRPDIVPLRHYSEKNIIGAIYNRIAIDCASILINHVRLDASGRYLETIDSGLNSCLTLEANKDQTSKAFIRNVVQDMLEEGNIAIVPISTSKMPIHDNAYDVYSFRVGRIDAWYPNYVIVEVYNDITGNFVKLTLPKNQVAIIENPLYSILNEPNSVAKRLVHKLAIMDTIDEQSGSTKLDLIVQLPYAVKTDYQKKLVASRQRSLENQLRKSKFGIGYIDSTEKVTQLNRPVENNVMKSVEYLTSMLYSQLGITQGILDGTADESTMLNYKERTIRPIMDAIVDELKRKFLSKTARTQGQTIMYFNDPFKLVPISKLADIADRFIRNEIMSPNEMRQVAGLKPVQDPKADQLRNPNINESEGQQFASTSGNQNGDEDYEDDEVDISSLSIADLTKKLS